MSQIDVLRPPERRVLYSLVIVKGSLSSNSIHRSQKNKMEDKTSCSVDEKKRKLRSQGFSKKKQEASLQSFIEATIKHQHRGQGQRWLCVNGRTKLMYGAIASRPNSTSSLFVDKRNDQQHKQPTRTSGIQKTSDNYGTTSKEAKT